MKNDQGQILFRASSVGNLMVGGSDFTSNDQDKLNDLLGQKETGLNANGNKVKFTDKKQIEIDQLQKKKKQGFHFGATSISYIKQYWLRNEHGYDEPVVTPQMLKGHLCEQDAIGLAEKYLKSKAFRVKNKKTFFNDFFRGTPDIILRADDWIEDMKTAWTKKTFLDAKISKLYYAQAQVYMDLVGIKKFRVLYTLVPTPDHLITEEKKRFYFKFNCDEENPHYIECSQKIERMHDISSIPEDERIKIFDIDYDEAYIEELKKRVTKAREIYNDLCSQKFNCVVFS